MKKFSYFAVALAACAALFMGCEPKVPTVERMTAISTAVGKAAGMAVELSKTKTEVKEAILQVLDVASAVVPGEGETFADAWRPIIDEEVGKLVEKGKISAAEGAIAKQVMYVASEGVDYIFKKYPKAKEYKELVSAAVAGFAAGFKSVVVVDEARDFDAEAYEYLNAKAREAKIK